MLLVSLFKIGGYILIIIPTLFAGVVLGFYLIQDYMIFLGEKLPVNHEYNFINPFEELNFKTKDGETINALLFKCKSPKGVVIYHHGNAGNIQGWGKVNAQFLVNDFDVLFYDYRGYGKSTGKIKREHHLHDDAKELLEQFVMNRQYDRIVLHGTSLGSGVAARLASKVRPDALILETPYFSFIDLINTHYPYLPATILSKYKLRTHQLIGDIDCPIAIFHGTDDEIIPFESAERLLNLNQKINLVTIKGGAHNNLSDYKLYQSELKQFLSEL